MKISQQNFLSLFYLYLTPCIVPSRIIYLTFKLIICISSITGLACLVSICKALDYTFAKEGRFKVGEKSPGDSQAPAISKKTYDPLDPSKKLANGNGDVHRTGTARPGSSFLPLWFEDAVELLFAFRGVGWDFGKYVHIPPETKPLERRAFLIATLNSFAYNYFALDLIESSLKLVPGVGTPTGGSIFFPSLPPLERYAFSTAIHIASGCALMTGFQMIYDLSTLIGVGLLGHDPTSWPPVIDNPWISTSLNEFWAKRWHQLLRQTFIVMGGIPGQMIAGRIGMVLGTFLASGLYHECASIAMGREWDSRVVVFFAMQGVFVMLERVWRQVFGKRVGGWPGRIWVYFVIMVLGQPMGKLSPSQPNFLLIWSFLLVDAWHMRGLAGGLVIPPIISPTRKFFFPLISHYTGIELNTDQF